MIFESGPDQSGGISGNDAVGRKVFGYHGLRTNNAPMPDMDPRKNCGIVADPDIIIDSSVLHLREKMCFRLSGFPSRTENKEWV